MLYPVILCGGSGTRLWPLSRALYPKQFVDLGKGRTLFKDTLLRAHSLTGIGAPIVVCNENHRFYVSTAFLECETNGQIILEPAPRNTAPAIALSAFAAQEKNSDDDPLLLVLPSDHLLKDDALFVEAVSRAITLAEQNYIVTFGVTPAGPETGFGYIHQGPPLVQKGFGSNGLSKNPRLMPPKPCSNRADTCGTVGCFSSRPPYFSKNFVEQHQTYLTLVPKHGRHTGRKGPSSS